MSTHETPDAVRPALRDGPVEIAQAPREVGSIEDVRELVTDEEYRRSMHYDPEGEPPPEDSRVMWRRVALVVLPLFVGASLLTAVLVGGWSGFVIGSVMAFVVFVASWPVLIAAWSRRVDEHHALERLAKERGITIRGQVEAKPESERTPDERA